MGIIALSEELDVPFPRRLFSALVKYQIEHGAEKQTWQSLKKKFEGGGCFLDIEELDDTELIAFKNGIQALGKHMEGMNTFADFEVDFLNKSFRTLQNHLNN